MPLPTVHCLEIMTRALRAPVHLECGADASAANVIALEQEEARERRAIAKSHGAPAPPNTSQPSPPYSPKDALRMVPQGGHKPPDSALNGNSNLNASYRQLKPTVVSPVRTMGTVRSKGNGAALIRRPDQEQFEVEEGQERSGQVAAGVSPTPPPPLPRKNDHVVFHALLP